MNDNPLFPKPDQPQDNSAAVELIRAKVARSYGDEPDAVFKIKEAKAVRAPSKHQLFMRDLAASGKSLAEIQTEWHRYYTGLPDREKHEVWREFYASNRNTPYQKLFQQQKFVPGKKAVEPKALTWPGEAKPEQQIVEPVPATFIESTPPNPAEARKIKSRIIKKVSANGKLKARHHVQSVLFGLGVGLLAMVIFLFSFFNEYIIAPFIQPSRDVSATPIILSNAGGQLTSKPMVIVPKINIQIPIDFNLPSNDEKVIESSLEEGTIHYPSTALPGQIGNVAIFGHSSRNIFNSGKYKFAFALLHRLTTGDVFYITYNGKLYAYQVFAREIVPPTQVGVLNDTKGKPSTAVLITCDPPGFSTNRLVVWGEQISPDPTTNTQRQATPTAPAPTQIADNGPTLWGRFIGWITFWN